MIGYFPVLRIQRRNTIQDVSPPAGTMLSREEALRWANKLGDERGSVGWKLRDALVAEYDCDETSKTAKLLRYVPLRISANGLLDYPEILLAVPAANTSHDGNNERENT